MSPTEPIGGDRNPEESAITGGAPPAAEPAPQTRDRRASIAAPVWIYGLAGLVLVLTALLADLESDRAIGTAIIGVVLLAIAALSVAGVVGAIERGGLGLVLAVVLTVLAFAIVGGIERGIFLACAAAILITAFAAFAAARRPGDEGEEPAPGVGNV